MAILDLADLALLREIWRTRSISGAVDRVGLSQPSISIRLGHLRKHFGDPLFVRTSSGMMPTPRMESLLPAIEQATKLLEGCHDEEVFDPRTVRRIFRVSLSSVGQVTVLPAVLRHLESIAPHLELHAVNLDRDTPRVLEAGEADLAIGFTSQLQAGFFEQTLIDETYLCIASMRHSRIRGHLDKARFLAEGHVSVDSPGTNYWLLDKALEAIGAQRLIKVRVPSFHGLAYIVETTELIAVVPARLAVAYAERGHVQALKVPLPCPSYAVKQYWHERFHRDAGNRWLRQTIFDLLSTLPAVTVAEGKSRIQRQARRAAVRSPRRSPA